MLATMQALTEGGRALAYFAAAARDKAQRHPDAQEQVWNKALFEYLVPIVKGFSTENAVEVTSLGVQVHGGMGYIEETGAAQYYRDARILPIYEGTTAIQANDLVGRKTLRDAGKVAFELTSRMRATLRELQSQVERDGASGGGEGHDELALIARRLAPAIDAYEQSVKFMLSTAAHKELRAVFLGSVPYLMLSGVVLAGWQMARAALACRRLMQTDHDAFYTRKLACSAFYAQAVLPRAESLSASILEGGTASRAAAVLGKP
jgi:hypothetical protein